MIDKKEKNDEVRAERGRRATAIRNTLGYSRRKFAQIIDIPFGTLQNWESIRHGGMNQDSAKRLSKALAKHVNVIVTEAWLLHGVGETPVFPDLVIAQSKENNKPFAKEEDNIQQELALFHKLNPNCKDIRITDQSMAPIFLQGDYVAGKVIDKNFIINTYNQAYIILTDTEETIVRFLEPSKTIENHFDLIAYAEGKKIKTHEAIKIKTLYKIIWMRRCIS